MNNSRHTPEQIVRKLREAEAKLGTGASVSEVVGELRISKATFHRNGARLSTDGRVERRIAGPHGRVVEVAMIRVILRRLAKVV